MDRILACLAAVHAWLAIEANLNIAGFALAVLCAVGAGAWALFTWVAARREKPNQSITIVTGYTIEQHEERLARREAEIRAELVSAHDADRTALLAQLDEVRRQSADAEASYTTRVAELERSMLQLGKLGDGIPRFRLDAAREALATGDDSAADAIFAEVEAMEAAAISRAAEAAFARGRIADADIRWSDAADYYARAARLAPTYDHLHAARVAAWRAANYAAALRFGEDLLAVAKAESGDDSQAYATALNGHALSLHAIGRFSEAEPLFRQALAIGEKTLGTWHPVYVGRLNNLAELLRETGRPAEAEPLFRQALAIDEKTLGTGHPVYATRLNNLAGLLQETGRPAEVESLFRQALAIDEKTLGTEHPTYAIHLNNLAGLLQETGRLAEAEPLFRQALAIDEKTLGTGHPTYAIHLNNLATLLRDMGRPAEAKPLFRQALAILVAVYGEDHPSTRIVAANLAALGPDEAGGGVGTPP